MILVEGVENILIFFRESLEVFIYVVSMFDFICE